jgi:hypothetical protein
LAMQAVPAIELTESLTEHRRLWKVLLVEHEPASKHMLIRKCASWNIPN